MHQNGALLSNNPTKHTKIVHTKEVSDYISTLEISQGQGVGDLFTVLDWQNKHLRGSLAVKLSALSMARGNGKSTWIAAICCAALDGPIKVSRGEILCIASSFGQGKIIFDHAFWFLKPALVAEPKRWRVMDTSQMASIEDRDSGMKLIVLGSDSRRAHGRAPFL